MLQVITDENCDKSEHLVLKKMSQKSNTEIRKTSGRIEWKQFTDIYQRHTCRTYSL